MRDSPFHCAWILAWLDRNLSLLLARDNTRRFLWTSLDYVRAADWPHCSRNRRVLCRTYTVCNSIWPAWISTCRPCCVCPLCNKLNCRPFWICRRGDFQRRCKVCLRVRNRDRPKNNLARETSVYRWADLSKLPIKMKKTKNEININFSEYSNAYESMKFSQVLHFLFHSVFWNTYLGKVLVDEGGILDEMTNVRIKSGATSLRRCCQLSWLGFDSFKSFGQFFLRDLIRFRFFGQTFHPFHQSFNPDFLFADYAGWQWWRWDCFWGSQSNKVITQSIKKLVKFRLKKN